MGRPAAGDGRSLRITNYWVCFGNTRIWFSRKIFLRTHFDAVYSIPDIRFYHRRHLKLTSHTPPAPKAATLGKVKGSPSFNVLFDDIYEACRPSHDTVTPPCVYTTFITKPKQGHRLRWWEDAANSNGGNRPHGKILTSRQKTSYARCKRLCYW